MLRDGNKVIGESSIIIEHVAGARLVPSLEARMWDRLCDQYISDVQAIVFETIAERFDERAVSQARGRLEMAYGMLEAQLAENEFLAGNAFTIADCAAGPGLFYAWDTDPWDEHTHPQLTRYYRALARRPSFAKVIADARPYRHLFPNRHGRPTSTATTDGPERTCDGGRRSVRLTGRRVRACAPIDTVRPDVEPMRTAPESSREDFRIVAHGATGSALLLWAWGRPKQKPADGSRPLVRRLVVRDWGSLAWHSLRLH